MIYDHEDDEPISKDLGIKQILTFLIAETLFNFMNFFKRVTRCI